ncbi:ABC transporter ATP-binding protein [Phenylobacterium sp.]|jgi:ABC-2 type transport system ATP-binding protein|uniref:ABC transporter ATP-binding protein n=1 Tax=Phenylobacterium sp. TaxID=1871053 RepID=UPI0037CC319E
MQAVLEASGLTKRFSDVAALDGLDLQVSRGEIVCLLGANGAGKTTTINLLLGFLKPTAGSTCVAGLDVAADPAAARARLGYVAEVVSLYPSLTGAENLAFFHALSGQPPLTKARRDEILQSLAFPMDAVDRHVGAYSKGMRQKLGLAIALAKDVEAILLDEPLSGLDPASANDLVEVLRGVASRGLALLVSTHDIFRAVEIATRIGIMRHGRLLEWLDPRTLSAKELEVIYLRHMAERAA